MSRSVHQTVKSVFGGKSKEEIRAMIEEGDPDVLELLRKQNYKSDAREFREIASFLKLQFDDKGTVLFEE